MTTREDLSLRLSRAEARTLRTILATPSLLEFPEAEETALVTRLLAELEAALITMEAP
jgi:hypothetical protein